MGIGDFFTKAWDWVKEGTKKVFTSAKDAANNVWQAVKDAGNRVIDVGGSAIKTVAATVVRRRQGVAVPAAIKPAAAPQAVVAKTIPIPPIMTTTQVGPVLTSFPLQVYTDVIQKPLGAAGDTLRGIGGLVSNPLLWIAGIVGAIVIVPPLLNRVK